MSLLPQSAYSAPRPGRAKRTAASVLASIVVLTLLAGGGYLLAKKLFGDVRGPEPQVCVAALDDQRVALDPGQMHFAALIAGVAIHKDLGTRGATIGLATAMQESSLRNLSSGDRDSLGLFQQRPSQGWGTEDQIQDPYYSSAAFYKELVKVDGWETGDVNDIAQKVQRSGVPDGYRKHVQRATVLARVLTGQAGEITCVDRSTGKGDPEALAKSYLDTFGAQATADAAANTVTVTAPSLADARILAMHAAANTAEMGVTGVRFGSREWRMSTERQQPWADTQTPAQPTTVVVALRGA